MCEKKYSSCTHESTRLYKFHQIANEFQWITLNPTNHPRIPFTPTETPLNHHEIRMKSQEIGTQTPLHPPVWGLRPSGFATKVDAAVGAVASATRIRFVWGRDGMVWPVRPVRVGNPMASRSPGAQTHPFGSSLNGGSLKQGVSMLFRLECPSMV